MTLAGYKVYEDLYEFLAADGRGIDSEYQASPPPFDAYKLIVSYHFCNSAGAKPPQHNRNDSEMATSQSWNATQAA